MVSAFPKGYILFRVFVTVLHNRVAMASQESIEKMQARQNYRNLWHTDLMRSIQADTPCNDTLSHTFSIFAFYIYTDIVSDFAQIVASRCGGM